MRRANLRHAVAAAGLACVTWLAFGRVALQLGHQGDSWAYMSEIRQYGADSIIAVQAQRPALPWAWAVGFALADGKPWIYHILLDVFLFGAALCLYGLINMLEIGSALFAFAAASLSVLWPADPTRYDIATLGNRQALFLYALGALLFGVALRRAQARYLVLGSIALLLSLLTYEAQLGLVLGLPLLLWLGRSRPWRRQRRLVTAAALAPALVWAALNLRILLTTSGQRTYQSTVSLDLTPLHLATRLRDSLGVLFWDVWQTPANLLGQGGVPEISFVLLASAITIAFLLALGVIDKGHAVAVRPGYGRLALVAFAFSVLAVAVFVVTPIPIAQPDRTQTFALAWAAVALCACFAGLVSRPGVPFQAPPFARPVVFTALCIPAVFLFFAMSAVYQRNYRQTWDDQRAVLGQIAQVAPDIDDGSLVLIAGLPDTRIIFPSGYTCEFALTWIEGHIALPAGAVLSATSAEAVTEHRINCGLLFNGRSLDPQVHIRFDPDGVVDEFPPFTHRFGYASVLMFEYEPGGGLRLLDRLPADLGVADPQAAQYDPRSRIRLERRDSRALEVLS